METKYDTNGLEKSIIAANATIRAAKSAIGEQRRIIAKYQRYLRDLESGFYSTPYTVDGLRHGIEQSLGHIDRLETFRQQERARIKEFQRMIATIEEQRRIQESIVVNVEFDRGNGDGSN